MPRSATKLTKSFEAHVKDLHRRADDLEKQLHAAGKGGNNNNNNNNNTDDRANRLRLPLCEIMADLILTDPSSCATKDIAGRLWRLCFYTRIVHWRKRISVDKKRNVDTTRMEESLSVFLTEGVTLYKYLIDKLTKRLAKKVGITTVLSSADEASTASFSQGSMSTAFAPPATESTQGVVQLLAACQLSLGDLFRYSQNLEQAEVAYQMSSMLAPGIGHAFNQLAVVCQLKEQKGSTPLSAVALYWYTRSLLVTNEPFTTSKANLERIFANNRDWLVKEEKETTDKSKSGQTRRFLGMFVDLHFQFFQGIGEEKVETLKNQINAVMERFQGLLEMSAFGDALLCRLVVIHAFSECYFDRPGGHPSALSMVMARDATYQFGCRLTSRVIIGLSKVADGKVPSSVRLLLPTLLLAEYTAAVAMPNTENGPAMDSLSASRRAFWESMILIWNKLDQTSAKSTLPVAAEELKDFSALRGFGPFSFISPCEDGLLSDEEAVEVLTSRIQDKKEKLNESASASTVATGASSNAVTDQGRLKLARLMQLGEKLSADTESTVGQCIVKGADELLIWVDTAEEDDGALPMEVENEDENVLMYKSGSDGGPALLVPGMLLQQEEMEEDMPPPPPASASKNSPERLPVFDATPVTLQQTDTPLAIPHPTEASLENRPGAGTFATVPNSDLRLPPGLQPTTHVLPPPPGFASPAGPTAATLPDSSNQTLGQNWNPLNERVETLSDALRLHGFQMQSANPFENPAPPGLSDAFNSGLRHHQREPDFLGNSDAMNVEAPSLLDSGLLNSLWMDDPKNKTDNPFAT